MAREVVSTTVGPASVPAVCVADFLVSSRAGETALQEEVLLRAGWGWAGFGGEERRRPATATATATGGGGAVAGFRC